MARRIKVSRGAPTPGEVDAARIDAAVRKRLEEIGIDTLMDTLEEQQRKIHTFQVILLDVRNSFAIAHSTSASTKMVLEELLNDLGRSFENLDLIDGDALAEPLVGEAGSGLRRPLLMMRDGLQAMRDGGIFFTEESVAEEQNAQQVAAEEWAYEDPDEIDNLSSEADVVERMMDRATQQGTMPGARRRTDAPARRRRRSS